MGDSVLGDVQDVLVRMHVNRVLCWLSVLLEAFPKGIVDTENNSIYARLVHRLSCVLRAFGHISEAAVLAAFLHIFENAAKIMKKSYRIYLEKSHSHPFYRSIAVS